MNDRNAPQNITYYSKIQDLIFSVRSQDEIKLDSSVNVISKEIMRSDGPASDGLYDKRMGTTDIAWECPTCNNRKTICPGHFGSINLRYPVKSPLFRDILLQWLKSICHTCGLPIVTLSKKVPPAKILNESSKASRTIAKCPHCGAKHYNVVKEKGRQSVFLIEHNEGMNFSTQELYNHHIKSILERVTDETVLAMGKPLSSHPRNLILNVISVCPNTIRPDIKRLGGSRSSNSDTTFLLKTIAEINHNLPMTIPPDDQITPILKGCYFNLDMTYHTMIKGGNSGDIKLITNMHKPPVAIAERLTGKLGRVRKNLMGKRAEYMIRSVITGDSKLRIDEVGVPMSHARDLEVPEVVSELNISRLSQYVLNGVDRYPGCRHIIKKINGGTYRTDILGPTYQLQLGDIVMRDMITGDCLCFNRQPSLLFSNIAGMRVVVMDVGETLRINPAICNFFNADFDGDQMNSIIPQNIQSRNECMMISKASRWFISPQKHAPSIGAFFDALIGLSELTHDGIKFDKWHAMQLFADVKMDDVNTSFTEKTYTNREVVSKLLPKINISGKKPSMYKEQYVNFLKYNPKDINIVIERGQLISGVLDKATTGQDVSGSIFHIIANEYGNDKAIECIFNLQQIVHKFFSYHGFTTGISDINISESAIAKIKENLATMILNSRKITQRLNSGKLIAPIGMSLKDFYESEQLNALSAGDDFVNPILADIDLQNNHMAKLILSGSKGKTANFISINGAIGSQTINGKRFPPLAGWGRTSPYFTRYDTEPEANGFVSMSFREGVSSKVYSFLAGEARHGLISNALSTSVTGYQNRISVKNLESIIIDNTRKASKGLNIIQPLYAGMGLDPSKMEKVKFPTVMISESEFKKYKTDITNIHKSHQTKQVESILEEEFIQLENDREYYRNMHLTLENYNPKEYVFTNQKYMAVDVHRIVEDVTYEYKNVIDQLDAKDKILDPIYAINIVRELCDNLGYVFLNELRRKQKKKISKYIVTATKMMQILIRSYLCTNYLLKKGVTNHLLDIIVQRIVIVYKKALIDPGYPVGILAAQCISEPMTQYVLDSKHRTGGGGGTKTNAIIRIQEILGAKDTDTMKNPHMLIMVKPEHETDKLKVQEIANHIEMIRISRFISDVRVFFEKYKEPKHPNFAHEVKDIQLFEKNNYGIKIPGDLAHFCIRISLNREELLLKSMKLETILIAIAMTYPEIFVMHTPENANEVYLRCYIRNSAVKKKFNDYFTDIVMDYVYNIKQIIVRGVRDIIAANVIDITKNVVQEDKSIQLKKVYGIYTTGSNTSDIIGNIYIDPYRTQSDSIEEVERVYGIMAARSKIINEMMIALEGLNPIHCTIFADEMTYSGQVTNIQRAGLEKRENSNITLRISFQTVIQVLQDAAINGLTDHISGISGPLVLGTNPDIGTTFNSVIVNQQFIDEYNKSRESEIDNL